MTPPRVAAAAALRRSGGIAVPVAAQPGRGVAVGATARQVQTRRRRRQGSRAAQAAGGAAADEGTEERA
ncbi:hypothetical protein AB0B63_29765 [Micromonospora sp. NPDC049081]|uniref:hypothetical protein n=1 Tax=Micromonospora sp. NPDC049081 TaxID=3155150 RepID=UPI0033E5FE1E